MVVVSCLVSTRNTISLAAPVTDEHREVRRAALLSFPCTPATINHLLARARDVDAVLRRTVYVNSLSASALPDARILTIAQREEAVRNGLGDREGGVRKAAAAMLGGWLDQAEGDLVEVSLGRGVAAVWSGITSVR